MQSKSAKKKLEAFRLSYLEELRKVSKGMPFVTDKMPHNFLNIALLISAIPEAKIIHVRRDPAATCWSNFKNYFSDKGLGYSYDLHDTINYCRLYTDLMNSVNVLFRRQIYQLDYEKLTINQEFETTKLLNYIGLKLEETCLTPHKNRRNVSTASQLQVRRKVYMGSSEEWRKFEPFLKGAFDTISP